MSAPERRIVDFLPALYQGILPAFFRRRIPEETLATCDDCAMCRRPGPPRLPPSAYFRPDAKCCTFYPSLPNYLVGALLASRGGALEEGRRRVRRTIRAGDGVGPRGLASTSAYDRRYARLSDRGFGRMHGLLCPYFVRGPNNCAIWPYRNSVCAAYYCRHVRGIPGAEFWSALNRYLGILEEALAEYALLRLGWPAERIIGSSAVERRRHTRPPRSPWQPSAPADRIHAAELVYRDAYRVVRALRPAEVERIGGVKAKIAFDAVVDCCRRMLDPGLPDRLRLARSLQVRKVDDEVLIEVPGHLSHALAAPIWESLRRFDGRTEHPQVAARLRRETGLDLSRGFLLALYRSGILVPAGRREARRASSREDPFLTS